MNATHYTLFALCGIYLLWKVAKWYFGVIKEAKARAEVEAQAKRTRLAYREMLEREQKARDLAMERAVLEAKELALAKAEEKRLKQEAAERKTEFNARQAKREYAFLEERLAQQYAMLDNLLLEQAGTVPGSRQFNTIQQKIITLNNQIHSSEMKFNKAVFVAREVGNGETA